MPPSSQKDIKWCVVMKRLKINSFNSVICVVFFGLAIVMGLPSYALACSHSIERTSFTPASVSLNTRGVDAGTGLGGWSSGQVLIRATGCTLNPGLAMSAHPTQTSTSVFVDTDGSRYNVFPTGIENIGYVINVGNAGAYYIINNSQTFVGTTNLNNSAHQSSVTHQTLAYVKFVATGPLTPGVYNLGAREFVELEWSLDWGPAWDTKNIRRRISYNSVTVTVAGATCLVRAADQNQPVVLPTVSRNSFQGVGSTAGSQRFTIGVDCPAGVALHATMTDANTPANRSNVLTLGAGSSAAGVGLQITATDRAQVVSYGADSRVAGTQNQWFVGGNANSPATNYKIPFTARYVQTAATVRPGTVRARSTITFSYQ